MFNISKRWTLHHIHNAISGRGMSGRQPKVFQPTSLQRFAWCLCPSITISSKSQGVGKTAKQPNTPTACGTGYGNSGSERSCWTTLNLQNKSSWIKSSKVWIIWIEDRTSGTFAKLTARFGGRFAPPSGTEGRWPPRCHRWTATGPKGPLQTGLMFVQKTNRSNETTVNVSSQGNAWGQVWKGEPSVWQLCHAKAQGPFAATAQQAHWWSRQTASQHTMTNIGPIS